jgi:molybdate transport system substrate-binding protein
MRRRALVLALLLSVVGCGAKKKTGNEVKVAAAADLALAFEEVGKAFRAETGIEPVFTFGSTGLLAKQVEEGAPFDLFAAANIDYVDKVVAKGACDGATKALYARGRIVVWSPTGVPARLEDLADPKYKAIAIANPDHAPYGRAARQALEKVGIWSQVEGRIVRGENVQQAMQYARSRNADVAIVALSLATVETGGASLPIDMSLHDPLDQAMVVCGHGPGAEAAKKFAAFVDSPKGREIMNRYGFLLAGEQPTPKAKTRPTTPPPVKKAGLDETAVRDVVTAWLDAQNKGDFAAYQALYAERFGGVKRVGARRWKFDRKGWMKDRERMFGKPMTVTADEIDVHVSTSSAVVRFKQTFEQGRFKDAGDKQLVIAEDKTGLHIGREEMLQSTVVEGPGSTKARGFGVLEADEHAWIVVGNGGGPTKGTPAMAKAGTGYDFAVLEDADALDPPWQKLIGQAVTFFPSGATCPIAGYRVLTVLSPHFGTVYEWRGDEDGDGESENPPLEGQDLVDAVLGGGGASYLVADAPCGGTGDEVAVLGSAAEWESVPLDDTLAKKARAAFRALDEWQTTQDDFRDSYAGKGDWDALDDAVAATTLLRSPDGKHTYAIVGARAGNGCGDFEGSVVELFEVKGTKFVPVAALGTDGAYDIPSTLLDVDADGRPEVAGYATLWAFNGTEYEEVYALDLGFRDCGC